MDGRFKYTPDFFQQVINEEIDGPQLDAFNADLERDKELRKQFEFYQTIFKKNTVLTNLENEEAVTSGSNNSHKMPYLWLIGILFLLSVAFISYNYNKHPAYPYAEEAATLYESELKKYKDEKQLFESNIGKEDKVPGQDRLRNYFQQSFDEKAKLLDVLLLLEDNKLKKAKQKLDGINPAGFKENRTLSNAIRYMILLQDQQRGKRALKFFEKISQQNDNEYKELAKAIISKNIQ